MSDNITMEQLAGDIRQRLDALGEQIPSDEKLEQMIRDTLPNILESDDAPEVVRKLRFGGGDDSKVGGKYARLGLTVADVEFLHDVVTSAQRLGLSSGPSEELNNTVSAIREGRVGDVAVDVDGYMRLARESLRAGRLSPEGFLTIKNAMDTAESGYGSQLIGNQYVGELWRGARAQAIVFPLIRSFEMTHPTAYLPVEANLPAISFVSESTGSSATNYGTTKTGSNRVQADAKKFVMHQMWSGEMEEDSIIPFLPFLREEAARGWAHGLDSVILNGDTTNAATGNINLDDADPADTEPYLAFDGIRHAGLVDNTGNSKDVGGALTITEFKSSKGRMLDATYKHNWGMPSDPNDLVYVADPETVLAVGFFDEVLTVDKYGAQATVLTGEQAKVLGHPLIASIDVSKTEADGKVSTTAANNTKGQVVAFNRRGCVVGTRRELKVETERLPATDQTRIVYSTRLSFGRFSPTGAASGIEWADVLYNISL